MLDNLGKDNTERLIKNRFNELSDSSMFPTHTQPGDFELNAVLSDPGGVSYPCPFAVHEMELSGSRTSSLMTTTPSRVVSCCVSAQWEAIICWADCSILCFAISASKIHCLNHRQRLCANGGVDYEKHPM